jgi:hypothetical protein
MDAVPNSVGELDRHVGQAGRYEAHPVVGHEKGAGDAADVAAALSPLGRAKAILGDDVQGARAVSANTEIP